MTANLTRPPYQGASDGSGSVVLSGNSAEQILVPDVATSWLGSVPQLLPGVRQIEGRERRGYLAGKRLFDLGVAALLLLVLAPVWLTAALLVRCTSRGGILFRQTRCGKNGKLFTCYKFRTMVGDAEARRVQLLHRNEATGPVFKIRDDPRMTWLGRRLRRTSIDELPQLVNVLRGEMSIVGPRPALPGEVAQYTPHERGRLAVKPGLTCLWQVNGRTLIAFERWIELDLEYIERRGLGLDLWLVLRTVPAVLSGRGAF